MEKKLSTTYILDRLERLGARSFTTDEFLALFRLHEDRGYQLLHRLGRKGLIKRLARGRYALVGLGPGEILGQPFYLATRLVEPSYVSFWSALNFYGWTEQAPKMVLVANTGSSGRRSIDKYIVRLVRLSPTRFYGYTMESQAGYEFPIAEREKAVIDCLWRPSLAGRVDEVVKSLNDALEELRVDVLEDYAIRMGSKTLSSRLGYLLSRRGVESRALLENKASSYVMLDPRGVRRGQFNSYWNVIDNLEETG